MYGSSSFTPWAMWNTTVLPSSEMPNVLVGTLPIGDQPLIPFYHDPTFHPILSGSGLQWRTHGPPVYPNFASLLGLRPQEKALIVCCESILYMALLHSLPR